MPKFSAAPYYILEDCLSQQETYNKDYGDTAMLRGINRTIVAANSFGMDLYLKTDIKYYKINVQNISGSPSDDIFTFYVTPDKSELTIDEIRNYIGYELYFRKEGIFYDYVDAYVPTEHDVTAISNINTNKFYLYFGKIYVTDNDLILIKYEGYKTFAYDIIPENNRSDTLKEFFNDYFDKLYTSQYNLFKNILTLSDPKEVYIKYLYYLAQRSKMTIPEYISDIKKREYVAALPELLKRKGSYYSLYIIWKVLCSGTTNHLNIYERWNDWPYPGDESPVENFKDIFYIFNPLYQALIPRTGAGPAYYHNSSGTTYTTRINTAADEWEITHNILYKYPFVQVMNNLNEVVYPYSIKYESTISLNIDFGPEEPDALKDEVSGKVMTWIDSTNKYEEIIPSPSQTWNINHNLNQKYPLVVVVNTNDEVIYPDSITFVDENNLTIDFYRDAIQGTVVVGINAESDNFFISETTSGSTWDIEHNLGTEDVIIQIVNENDEMIVPDRIKVIDTNNIRVTFSESLPDVVGGKVCIYTVSGASPYPTFAEGEYTLSPHYLVEIDLTNEPFGNDYIINQTLIDDLVARWEEIRPVCKYAHYRELIAPITNFSGRNIELYNNNRYIGYLSTKCCKPVRNVTDSDNMLIYRTYTNRKNWTINHNLNTPFPIVQCFDLDSNMIMPDEIKRVTDNTITIEWYIPTAGYAYLTKQSALETITPALSAWTFTHGLALSADGLDYTVPSLAIQQTKYDNATYDTFIPQSVQAIDENTILFTLSTVESGYAAIVTGSYSTSASENTNEWVINHNLDTELIQIQFFDENNKVIYPSSISILSGDAIKATFGYKLKPAVVIKSLGLQTNDMETIYNNINYAKVGSAGSKRFDSIFKNDLETPEEYKYSVEKTEIEEYYIKVIINTRENLTITEFGLFDVDDNILFYTSCNEIYKPKNIDLVIWFKIEKSII